MNPIEFTLSQPGDNKTHWRADIFCNWTPLSLQGEHFRTAIFWMPDGGSQEVKLLVVEKLLAIIFILVTIQTEGFANFFGNLKNFQDDG